MPPAFVLSQNQTLKLMYDRTPAGISESKTGISGSRSCTKITIWCVCVFETYELPHRSKLRAGSIRNGINLTDQPIPRGYRRPGRRPHVPSSKPTMSKSRRASSPGSIGSGHRLYRLKRGAKTNPTPKEAVSAAGVAVYGRVPDASTGFFAIMLQVAVQQARSAVTASSLPL